MFRLNSLKYNTSITYANGDPFVIYGNVSCTSDVVTKSKRKYINIKIHNSEMIDSLRKFDTFAKSCIKNYQDVLDYNTQMFVKLPFRYNRFEIVMNNYTTSELFSNGKTFDCKIECGGVVHVDDNRKSMCMKITSIG